MYEIVRLSIIVTLFFILACGNGQDAGVLTRAWDLVLTANDLDATLDSANSHDFDFTSGQAIRIGEIWIEQLDW